MRQLLWIAAAVTLAATFAIAGPEEDGIAVGDEAPAFRLNDHVGKALDLRSHGKGAWAVVAFYPKSFTPG